MATETSAAAQIFTDVPAKKMCEAETILGVEVVHEAQFGDQVMAPGDLHQRDA
jgi:hypothetical protein